MEFIVTHSIGSTLRDARDASVTVVVDADVVGGVSVTVVVDVDVVGDACVTVVVDADVVGGVSVTVVVDETDVMDDAIIFGED